MRGADLYLISDLCAALLVVPGSSADLGNHHRVQQDPGGLLFVDPSGKFLEVVLLGHRDLPALVSQLLPNCPPKSLLQPLGRQHLTQGVALSSTPLLALDATGGCPVHPSMIKKTHILFFQIKKYSNEKLPL